MWGTGLLVHTIGAMLNKGYEHVQVSEPAKDGNGVELSDCERRVLAAWTDHKKSAPTLFILLALTGQPRWSSQIRDFITDLSNAYLTVDEQSLHRRPATGGGLQPHHP